MGDEELYDTLGDYIPGVGPFGEAGETPPVVVPTTTLLPETLSIAYGSQIRARYDVLRVGTQRRLKSSYGPLHTISILSKSRLTAAEEGAFYEFYCDRRGGYEPFAMFDFTPDYDKIWTDVYLGTGNGDTTAFELKGKGTSNVTITVAGVSDADFSVSTGTGTNSQDKIVFGTAPTGIIKARFNGIRYFPTCVFSSVEIERSLMVRLLYSTGFEIEELQP
jgi:hypothetical protein